MLTYISYRDKGQGEIVLNRRHLAPLVALESLVVWEIGFGGYVSAVSESSVEVKTNVMGCLDRVLLTGSKEDLKPIMDFLRAFYWLKAEMNRNGVRQNLDSKLIDNILVETGGNPLLVTTYGVMKYQGGYAKMALLELILQKLKVLTDIEQRALDKAFKLELKVLAEVMVAVLGDVMSFQDAVEIVS